MKEAVIIGPYTIHNFGDDLIGAIMAKDMINKGYRVRLPFFTRANSTLLNLHSELNPTMAVNTADTVVIGGGGMFGDAGTQPKDTYRIMSLQASVRGRLQGKRVLTTGVGAGPLSLKKSYLLTYLICLLSEKIGVRDHESFKFLSSIGIRKKKIVEGADIALLSSMYFPAGMHQTRKLGLQFDIGMFKDILEANNNIQSIMEEIVRFIDQNVSNIVLISNNKLRSELYYCQQFDIDTLCYTGYLPPFMKHLSEIRAIFTSHLHLAITAYSYRIPCFSLYVREKTKRFYDQIGHPERAIDLKKATGEDCVLFLEQMSHAEWTSFDEERLREMQRSAKILLDII